MKRNLRSIVMKASTVIGVLAILVAIVISGGSIHKSLASTSTSTSQTINLTVNEVITLSLSTSSWTLPALTPLTAVTSSASATVTTNSASGWNLQVNRVNTSSTLTSSTIQFPDQTAFSGSNATTSTGLANTGQNLSFREMLTGTSAGDYNTATWGTADTDPSAFYAGFPTAAVTYASTSSYVGAAQTVVMELRANAPATQVATNYSGSIVITAIALP